VVASPCGTELRDDVVAGGIDATVRCIETVIETLPTFKFRNAAGKQMPIRDLAGLAQSVQAATSVPQGASFDERVHRGKVPRRPGGDECDAAAAGGRSDSGPIGCCLEARKHGGAS
jgi:hypothetical protein